MRHGHDAPTGVVSFPPVLKENPYQRLLYAALAPHGYAVREGELKVGWLLRNRRRARILHFHWPWAYYTHGPSPRGPLSWIKCVLFGLRLAAARALGYRVAWTIHEVYPLKTENRRLEIVGARLLALASHVLIAHDASTAEQARRELGRAAETIAVVPHSSFDGAYPAGRGREQVRADLGIPPDAFVFLVFGHVSAYKQVGWFVEAFCEAAPANAFMVVAGLVMDEPSAAAVRAAAKRDHRIRPLLEFIGDERVAELHGAADVAICPRQDGGTSGVLVLALTMGVAAVAARAPAYEQITEGERAAWLFTPYDRDSLMAALARAAADPAEAQARGAAGRAAVAGASWHDTGVRIAALFDVAVAGSERRREVAPEPA
jgi:beta-1,4-mannosyltransferase